jgi:hypothetical protein
MIIDTVTKTVDPVTYEVRYQFTGSITPETLQDALTGAYGASYEQLGRLFGDLIRAHLKTNDNAP